MTPVRDRRAGARGFTLLELLIAITLLGLLMAALFGGLRLGVRVWESSETRLDATARIQVVEDFLRQRLTQILPLAAQRGAPASHPVPLFQGEPSALRFPGMLPEHLGAGLYVMELALSDTDAADDTGDLVLRWQAFEPTDDGAAALGEEVNERVLIERVASLELAYFGALDPRAEPEWLPEWPARADLPRLIRIVIRFPADDARRWPELVVRPMIDVVPLAQF